VDLSWHPGRPRVGADHRQVKGAREHQDPTNWPGGRNELGHPAAVGEARCDEPIRQALHGLRGESHQGWVADRTGEFGGHFVIVEDPAAVLIHDHNIMTLGAEAIGSFADAGAHAKDRVKQRDVSHARQSALRHRHRKGVTRWRIVLRDGCGAVAAAPLSTQHDGVVMKRQMVSSGGRWESIVGYSRAVRVGQWVSVAGTTAAAEGGGAVGGDDIGEQAREALRRVRLALEQAGARLEDVVRTRMFVTDISRWEEVGRAHGEVFGEIRPATSMVEVSRLIDPALLVEIEADAVVS